MQIKPLLHSSSFRQAATIAFICLLISSAAIIICDNVLNRIMKSHVRGMIFENLENQALKGLFNHSTQLAHQLRIESPIDHRKDHFIFIINPNGNILYGPQHLIHRQQIDVLQQKRSVAPTVLSLKTLDHELFGLLVPLTDGGLYFNAYDIQPMIQQTRIIPLMTGAGLLAIQLMILLISFPFSLHNLFRVNHIIEVLTQYAQGKHDVRVNYRNNGDEFGQLAREINLVLGRTQTLMEEVRTITSHVAHELKTPLTRLQHKLINVSESLTDKELTELENAIKETEQIQQLFRSIMRLSEVETGQVSHQKNKINAYDILYEAYEYYQPLAELYNIQLKLSASKKHYFYADKILIFQAISNLIDNAIKYAPESQTITLGIKSTPNKTLISVSDQGKGIRDADKQTVTKRFKRLTHKKEVFGHGLGLTLVKAITTLHNGELTLENNHPGLTVCLSVN
ncbi:sensor histidine kinase [Marinomonas aquiplantarum]|uniref:histidine kinase n=1 Tax=Marinomonas aquiplantarum TaxID=491951 RepID=A0A366D7U5_9GAMM|nr:HAMP domain-containing sensor histidine kinase [Marinomonas aquiplantarum]MBX2847361.1 HAMP domain-containing histidine kinase [Acidiferrobacterales bacterium]RBO86103.1 signal transduction histidine kinase [Marinomonas aquiplantarum]